MCKRFLWFWRTLHWQWRQMESPKKNVLCGNVPPVAFFTLNCRKQWIMYQGQFEEIKNTDLIRIRENLTWDNNDDHELHSIICHHGTSPSGGHYTCFVKHENGWFHHNDDICRKLEFTQIKSAVESGPDSTSYTLIYVNKNWMQQQKHPSVADNWGCLFDIYYWCFFHSLLFD